MEDIIIRRAEPSDVPEMAVIETESFDSPWSASEIEKDVAAGGGVYVAAAEAGSKTAGFAEMRCVAGEAQIYNIAVAPGLRKKGIGEALLRHMIDAAEDNDCGLATLEVRDGNKPALALYEKLGFREVGRRRGYYNGMDAILMDLDLSGGIRPYEG